MGTDLYSCHLPPRDELLDKIKSMEATSYLEPPCTKLTNTYNLSTSGIQGIDAENNEFNVRKNNF